MMRNQILPFSWVYFTALDRRLSRIWLILVSSPTRRSCRIPVTSTWSACPLAFAMGRMIASTEETTSFKANSSRFSTTLPLSILDTSRISLIRLSRCWPEDMIFLVYSRTFAGFSASAARSVVKPRTAFMGVRMSWDMLERNVFLASTAA